MLILDTAGDTIQAEGSAASSITVSCYGIETASGTDNYKRLGVAQLTGAGTQDVIYTVPASTVTICSVIVFANTSGSARTIKLWDVENEGSPGDANAILGTVTIAANSSIIWNKGNIMEIPNAAGGGSAAHAILDGSVHSDSVADAVTRGSIIYGNATPKWDELVKGAVDTFLGSDGTDVSYRTAAQVLASLSGEAAAAFSFNDQNITNVGSIALDSIISDGAAAALTITATVGQAVTVEDVSFDGGVVSGMGTLGCGVITQSGTTLANTYQPLDDELTSLAALGYVAASFVKMTGANTFALRTLQQTSDDLEATIDHDNLLNFAANEHYLQSAITATGTIASGTWEATDVGLGYGGTGQSTAQLAINALTDVAGGTNEHVLTKDTGTGNAIWKAGAGGGTGFGRPLVFTPQMNEPPSANFATLDLRNYHPVLDFDATTNESAVFRGVLPTGYASGGLTVYIHYAMTSAEVNTVDWDVAFERIGDQQLDIDGDSFAAVNSVDNTTVPGTTGLVDVVNVTFTDGADMDSIAAGESFRIKVTRDAASDDAAGDAEILFVVIKET